MLKELRELAATHEATLSRTSAPAPAARAEAEGDASAYGMATRLAHPKGKGKGDPYNASSPVLYQTATFELDPKTMSGEYDYTRSGNPTRHMLEEQMADLEGATKVPPQPRLPPFCYAPIHAAIPRRRGEVSRDHLVIPLEFCDPL